MASGQSLQLPLAWQGRELPYQLSPESVSGADVSAPVCMRRGWTVAEMKRDWKVTFSFEK